MAKIKNLRLKIQPTNDSTIHKVTVDFGLSFPAADWGKKFRYSIKLFGSDIGESSTPSASPLYQFQFGNSLSKLVTGGQITQNVYSHTQNLPREVLDEDRDFVFPDPSTGHDHVVVRPDELVAYVRLERGGGPFVMLEDEEKSAVKTITA